MKKQRRKIGGAVPSHAIIDEVPTLVSSQALLKAWHDQGLLPIQPQDLVARIESAEVGEPMELRRAAPATLGEAIDHIEEAVNVLLAMATRYEGNSRREILWNCGQMLEQTYQVTLALKEDQA